MFNVDDDKDDDKDDDDDDDDDDESDLLAREWTRAESYDSVS